MAAPAAIGGAGAGANVSLELPNIPADFRSLLASDVNLFIIKTRELATNNIGRATYTFKNRSTPKKPECFTQFQKKFLKFDTQIVDTPASFYTWILKDFKVDGKRHLVFAQTPSKQEVGTLHMNIDALTASGTVFIAGELKISEGREYYYNILSGSYSAKLSPDDQVSRNLALKGVLISFGIPEKNIHPIGYEPIIDIATITMDNVMRKFYENCGMTRIPEEPNSNSSNNMGGGARRRRTRKYKHTSTLKRGRSPRNCSR